MRRVVACAVVVGGSLIVASARSQVAVLTATVEPGALRLTDASGAHVSRLAPGTYTIAVEDRSPIHNVHLEGPGVSRHSGLTFEGSTAWTVDLRDGVYTVVSDPQADSLALTVVVGSPPEPRLVARVTDSEIALELADGTDVEQLEPGTYAVRVDDRSRLESFRLLGPGVEQHTQRHVPFSTTWLVTLTDGVYHFFSDRRPAGLRGSFRVGSPPLSGSPRTLRAITGPDFAIALVGEDSAPVARLARGSYRILVDDRSADHNFRLNGPGVNVATTLAEVRMRELTVRLTGGTYSFLCDPHTQTMLATFTVPRAPAQRLAAIVAANGRVALRGPAGGPVRALRAGNYVMAISDRSRDVGFRLVGPGVRRATGATFRGTATWRLRLTRGTYRYGGSRLDRALRVR
jgi:hypothetical protein